MSIDADYFSSKNFRVKGHMGINLNSGARCRFCNKRSDQSTCKECLEEKEKNIQREMKRWDNYLDTNKKKYEKHVYVYKGYKLVAIIRKTKDSFKLREGFLSKDILKKLSKVIRSTKSWEGRLDELEWFVFWACPETKNVINNQE